MTGRAERHHWLNTIVGLLDSAFYLSAEEQYAAASIVGKLLDWLRIPDRALPGELPMAVVQEMHGGYYTIQLEAPAAAGTVRPVRGATDVDCVASLEAWCAALSGLITTAYPQLDPAEKLAIRKVFSDLLAAIGVPHRVAAFMPDQVLYAHTDVDLGV